MNFLSSFATLANSLPIPTTAILWLQEWETTNQTMNQYQQHQNPNQNQTETQSPQKNWCNCTTTSPLMAMTKNKTQIQWSSTTNHNNLVQGHNDNANKPRWWTSLPPINEPRQCSNQGMQMTDQKQINEIATTRRRNHILTTINSFHTKHGVQIQRSCHHDQHGN